MNMSIIENIQKNRARSGQVADLKYRLLQRFTMPQLQQCYEDYIGPSTGAAASGTDQDSIVGGIMTLTNIMSSGTPPRRKMVAKLVAEMSLETIKDFADKHKIKNDDIVVV